MLLLSAEIRVPVTSNEVVTGVRLFYLRVSNYRAFLTWTLPAIFAAGRENSCVYRSVRRIKKTARRDVQLKEGIVRLGVAYFSTTSD